jgi:SAM-dependent methyltransferase
MCVLDESRLEKRTVELTLASDTRQAFDSVAPDYHRSNSENPLLCEMRRRTIAAIRRHLPRGSQLLDLGCGPGTDAETLAGEGYTVTAIDGSPRMVDEARYRIRRAGLDDRVAIHHLAIEELDRLALGQVDGVYSDFGPLNCADDLELAAQLVARCLRPGGLVIASVIGRVCPWELALYAARGDVARAGVRFSRGRVPVPLNEHTVWTRYYTPAEFERPFRAAGFRRISLRGLGIFVPPPYLQAFAVRHPSLIRTMWRVDDRVGGWPGLRNAGDHFLVVLRKDSASA